MMHMQHTRLSGAKLDELWPLAGPRIKRSPWSLMNGERLKRQEPSGSDPQDWKDKVAAWWFDVEEG
jgi:hypothetical protein